MTIKNLSIALLALGACATSKAGGEPASTTTSEAGATKVELDSLIPAGSQQLTRANSELVFKPCNEGVDNGCEMAVVAGDPSKAGPYTLRFRTSGAFVVPPHSHPGSEGVTILSGTVSVGFGTSVDKSKGTSFGPGDFYMNRSGSIHYLWTDGPVELQATGMGPRIFDMATKHSH